MISETVDPVVCGETIKGGLTKYHMDISAFKGLIIIHLEAKSHACRQNQAFKINTHYFQI
jgi:hypothetical protein